MALAHAGLQPHTEGMKARWTMKCECCKKEILVGTRFTMFKGRPWLTAHVIEYQKQRRLRITT